MPEGPEVKIIAEQLNQKLQGQTLLRVDQIGGRFSHSPAHSLVELSEKLPICLEQVKCHGKLLWFEFAPNPGRGYSFLLNTLGMSGSWKLNEQSKHSAVKLTFNQDTAYFDDIRHFGTLKYLNDLWSGRSEHNPSYKFNVAYNSPPYYRGVMGEKLKSLGLDPLQSAITLADLRQKFQKPITLAELLMRQDLLAGIGNYLKCEILYQAKLSPHRIGSSLLDFEWQDLLHAINTIPKQSYLLQGASFKTYQHVDGKGNFASFFKVYNQKFDPLGNPVIKETTKDKRSTYWAPNLQK